MDCVLLSIDPSWLSLGKHLYNNVALGREAEVQFLQTGYGACPVTCVLVC